MESLGTFPENRLIKSQAMGGQVIHGAVGVFRGVEIVGALQSQTGSRMLEIIGRVQLQFNPLFFYPDKSAEGQIHLTSSLWNPEFCETLRIESG